MKQIPLTQGKFALVDDEDYERVTCLLKWRAKLDRNVWYARTTIVQKIDGIKISKTIAMSRYILNVTDPNEIVDHKDHDGLNNQKSNLRICTKTQNGQNRRKKKNSKSNYLGVSYAYDNRKGKHYKFWIAVIRVDGKNKHLEMFPYTPCGEILAGLAYDIAAEKHRGEFANLNFKSK